MRQDEMNYTDRELIMNSELDVDNIPDRALKAILEELKQGNKIQAIKIYREVTGEELREAKNAIESVGIKASYQEPITRNMWFVNLLVKVVIVGSLLLVVLSKLF